MGTKLSVSDQSADLTQWCSPVPEGGLFRLPTLQFGAPGLVF